MRGISLILAIIYIISGSASLSASEEVNSQEEIIYKDRSSVLSDFEANMLAKELNESLRLAESKSPNYEAELRAASARLGIPIRERESNEGEDNLSGFAKRYSAGDAYFQALQDPNSPESKAIERRRLIDFAINSLVVLVVLASAFLGLKYGSRQGIWRQRKYRILVTAFAGWTAFVVLRTSDSYELLGLYVRQWDDDTFFVSWLFPPTVLLAAFYAIKWVKAGER